MGLFRSLMSVMTTDGKTGTPFRFDANHTVYYKGNGVSKIDAAKAGGFFKGYGYFTDTNQSDVQISADNADSPVKVGIIIGGRSVSPESEEFFRNATEGLEEILGRPVSMHLMDVNLADLKQL